MEFSFHNNYLLIVTGFCLVVGILSFAFVRRARFIGLIRGFFRCLKENVLETRKIIKNTPLKFLLLIPLLGYLYFSCIMPISHDEAFTYIHFIKPPFWVGASYYPAPNNHLFFTLLANISESVPFFDLRFAVRLPAIIASLLTLIVAFRFVRKFYSQQAATLVVSIMSVGTIFFLYSFYSRGYSLLCLFVVICIYMAFNILREGNRTKHWTIFCLSSILGFYTMPTFLYPFLSINIFILCFNYKNFWRQVYFNLWIVVVVFLLYLPAILFSGIDSLINNQFVVPISRATVLSRLPGFAIGTLTEIYGLPYFVLLPMFGAIIVYTFIKKEKQLLSLWLTLCVLPFLLIIGQSAIPFFRSFVYWSFVITWLCIVPFDAYWKRVPAKFILIAALLVQLGGSILFYSRAEFYSMITASYGEVVETTLENGKKYYIRCGLIYTNYVFEADRRGYNSTFENGGNAREISVDTIKGFDYCIIDSLIDRTTNRKPELIVPGFQYTPVNIYLK